MPQSNAFLARVSRFRSTLLGALLVIALAVTGIVTLQAYRASKNYKAMVERVLNTYVATAAYEYRGNVSTAMTSCVAYMFRDLPSGSATFPADVHACGNNGTTRFDYDYAKSALSTHGYIPGDVIAAAKAAATHSNLAQFAPDWYAGAVWTPSLHGSQFVAFAIQRNQNAPKHLVAVVTDGMTDSIAHVVMKRALLLSPNIAGGGKNENWVGQLFAGPVAPASGKYSAADTLAEPWSDLRVQITLKNTALSSILPNGRIPPNNGPFFLLLFTLALGLVASSVLLLRRESQLARARASFVSSVSHELRTPLAQIRMFAEMLLLGRARTEAEQRRSVEIIDNEAKRLSHLVENVLQAARSERGTVTINPTDCKLAPVIRDASESFMTLAETRKIDYRFELQENLSVSVDADAVRHIVLNLLDNASKYGPVGQRVTIGLALFDDAARMWVDDEGPGVPARERERVFQAFYRSPRELHSTTAGSGIGLAIVRELAALHGGSAWIEDAPGRGARVVVEFPGAYVAAEQQSTDWAVA